MHEQITEVSGLMRPNRSIRVYFVYFTKRIILHGIGLALLPKGRSIREVYREV